jgi:hypothetical protein
LAEIPELEAHKSGREVLLSFKKDIGPVLSGASCYTDALLLEKAAKILRKDMINHKFTFDDHLNEVTVDKAVPSSLVEFVCIIEHGIDVKTQLEIGSFKIDLAMAHLLQYNCFTDFKESSPNSRHIKDRETPFPIFMGMPVYAKTRKKGLVEMMNDYGLSIP